MHQRVRPTSGDPLPSCLSTISALLRMTFPPYVIEEHLSQVTRSGRFISWKRHFPLCFSRSHTQKSPSPMTFPNTVPRISSDVSVRSHDGPYLGGWRCDCIAYMCTWARRTDQPDCGAPPPKSSDLEKRRAKGVKLTQRETKKRSVAEQVIHR